MTTGILLVAHGSPVPAANRELLELIPHVAKRSGFKIVEPAFLEGADPSIPDGIDICVSKGATTVVVIPYFLLLGKHVAHDLPALLGQAEVRHPHVQFVVGRHLADHDGLGEIVLQRMKESGFFATMDAEALPLKGGRDMEEMESFACPSCGHIVQPAPLEGERGNQDAACTSCAAKFTRTFAKFEGEWVFGLWRSVDTGKVACTYYKTAFGTHSDDC